ncbi:MAG: YtxH domain-containing protein [bacterium]|nr:YtxH domain-containing protein [bacterium]
MSKSNDGIGFFIGLLAGTAIGISAGMILAPRSGEESRRLINDRTAEYKAKMADLLDEYRKKASDLASDFQVSTSEAIERGKQYYKDIHGRCTAQAPEEVADNEPAQEDEVPEQPQETSPEQA